MFDLTVSTLIDLNAAILAANALAAGSGTATIELGADIALDGAALNAINLHPGVTLDLLGHGHALDGGGTRQGLFVYAGKVAVSDLLLENMRAQGGQGWAGGGGGAGLGGA
ncbi:MAG: hypothetical protein ACOYOH_17565, partial [Paracraurococcus sp.]